MNYKCNTCLKESEGKAWISIQTPEQIVYACSYLCYKRNLDHIPKRHFHLILNPEDFNEPRPVFKTPTEETFNYLTEADINELSNEQYSNYKDELDEQFLLNPVKSEVYYAGLKDDKHTEELEGDCNYNSSDEEPHDDY